MDHDVLEKLKGLLTDVYGKFWRAVMWQNNTKGNFWKHMQMFDGPQWVSQFVMYSNRAERLLLNRP